MEWREPNSFQMRTGNIEIGRGTRAQGLGQAFLILVKLCFAAGCARQALVVIFIPPQSYSLPLLGSVSYHDGGSQGGRIDPLDVPHLESADLLLIEYCGP